MNTPIPICIFVKSPRPGRVKTRLADTLGVTRAAELARAFLSDTISAVAALPWARPLVVIAGEIDAGLLDANLEVWPQGEGNLGQRLERGLRLALAQAPAAIAIGADTPGLPRALLEDARRSLGYADAVIGPSNDGGFYLLGVRRCPPGLLDDVRWSDPNTCADTQARLDRFGLRTEVIAPWFDVDRPEDLDHLSFLLGRNALHAPHTANLLFSRPPMATRARSS